MLEVLDPTSFKFGLKKLYFQYLCIFQEKLSASAHRRIEQFSDKGIRRHSIVFLAFM
jgi:hypothetical protein